MALITIPPEFGKGGANLDEGTPTLRDLLVNHSQEIEALAAPVRVIAGGFLPNNPEDGAVSSNVFGCTATAYNPAEPDFAIHWCIVLDVETPPKQEMIVTVSVASFGGNPVEVPSHTWQAFDPLHPGVLVLWVGAFAATNAAALLDCDITFSVSVVGE